MNIITIRSDRIYRKMINASQAEKENIYRNELMKPFELLSQYRRHWMKRHVSTAHLHFRHF